MLQRLVRESEFAENFSFSVTQDTALFCAAPKEWILREGDRPNRLYYLVQGRVKLSQTLPNGKIFALDFLQAPCFLGELELLKPGRTAIAAQAVSCCRLLALDLGRCRAQLLADPVFLLRLCRILAEKERRRARALAQAQTYPLSNRLAFYILMAAQGDWYQERNIDACQYLGVSYRHLQQTLGEFVRRGWLQKRQRGYLLADRAALETQAQELREDWAEALR